MEQKLTIILLARDGILSNSTLDYLLKRFLISHVLVERRDKKKEIKTYINTQGLIRFILFLIKSFFLKYLKRHREKSFSPEEICRSYNVPFTIVTSHNSKKSLEVLDTYSPDLLVICAARIISTNVIEKSKIGILNCHPGWLPDYRGWDALRWSVYYNKNIGVTVHFINDGVDTGDIVVRKSIETENFTNFTNLYQEALKVRLKLLEKAISQVIDNSYKRTPQNLEDGKRYYRMGFLKIIIVNLKLYFNYKKTDNIKNNA